jgi:hypothetical protein
MAAETLVGQVSDFFAKPVVAGIDLIGPLKVGDTIHIKGHTTDMIIVVQCRFIMPPLTRRRRGMRWASSSPTG